MSTRYRLFFMVIFVLALIVSFGGAGAADEMLGNLQEDSEDLRITIVYDNTSYDSRLTSAWGFAALIEYRGNTLLFDAGGVGLIMLGNMRRLDIDPVAIDTLAFSHIHGDHTDGLWALLGTGAHPPVYIPPSFPDDFKNRVSESSELIEVTPGMEIADGIFTTGEMNAGSLVEQALVIHTDSGLVVITGCAHPGIVSIVEQAKALFDDSPVHLVIGGFHLGGMSASSIQAILDDLRELGVERVSPTHCTGEQAIEMFAEEYGDDYVEGGAGRVFVVEADSESLQSSPTTISPETADQVEPLHVLDGHNGGVPGLAFLPDSIHLTSVSGEFAIRLWDLTSGEDAHNPIEHNIPVYNAAFSPDGSLLAAGNPDDTVQLWDVETGEEAGILGGPGSFVMSVAFSPDGAIVAAAGTNGTIKLWDVDSGQEIHTLTGHNSVVPGLAFSPDDSLLASSSAEGSTVIRLWDVESGQERLTFSGHTDNVYGLAFSPDGTLLASASGDGTAKLWDVESGQVVSTLRGHRDRVYGVAFSPDGTLLASSAGTRIMLWDVQSGQALHTLDEHGDLLVGLAFSPDGALLASYGFDENVILWSVP